MKTLGALFLFIAIASAAIAQASKSRNFYLFIGTYTNPEKTNGIYVYRFDAATGDATEQSKFTDIKNPSYLAVSKDKKNVYSVSEAGPDKGMNAFSFDMASGKLTYLNSASSGGGGPCYVSVDDKKRTVFAANYGSGSLGAIRLNADGSLTQEVQSIQHEGSGINKERQAKPHVHSAVLSPDDRFLLVQDLGTDKVNVYRYQPENAQPLAPFDPPFAMVKAGGGPRHLTFHPNGKFAYVILEMGGDIVAFDYKNGKLTTKQTITMLAPGFKGDVGAADIHISPDGKFLYGSNRGDANDIVIYSIDKKGMLKYYGRESSMIDNPRNFAIDPTGNFLLVANQDGNDIITFKRDQQTGLLTNTGKKISVDKPVCLKFVAID
jgi:6-phosphogluconolactonase